MNDMRGTRWLRLCWQAALWLAVAAAVLCAASLARLSAPGVMVVAFVAGLAAALGADAWRDRRFRRGLERELARLTCANEAEFLAHYYSVRAGRVAARASVAIGLASMILAIMSVDLSARRGDSAPCDPGEVAALSAANEDGARRAPDEKPAWSALGAASLLIVIGGALLLGGATVAAFCDAARYSAASARAKSHALTGDGDLHDRLSEANPVTGWKHIA